MAVMELPVQAAPIRADRHGVYRIGKTRVRLETVVTAFELGSTAEEISQKFPALERDEVYSVLGYYLHNKTELDRELDTEREIAEAHLQELRKLGSTSEFYSTLLERKANLES